MINKETLLKLFDHGKLKAVAKEVERHGKLIGISLCFRFGAFHSVKVYNHHNLIWEIDRTGQNIFKMSWSVIKEKNK